MFKALLLAVWYDLSDVKLAEALEDRASFRRFCGFASHEPTPERTAFVRYRRELVTRSLDRVLFEAVTTQLDGRGMSVRTGTLVDATLIASASIKTDDEARWAGHRRKKPIHGYKAHVATDEAAGLVRSVEITTANVHDGTMLEALLPQDPGEVYGDSAYAAGRFTDVIRARGGQARVVYTHTWVVQRRALGSKPGTLQCGRSVVGSRRCSARGSARMAYGRCAGWGSPKQACRCGSPQQPTICAA